MTEQHKFELTAQESIKKLQEKEPENGTKKPVGMITNRDETLEFMCWITNPARKNKQSAD